jgi:hypothetical protein
VTAEAYEACDAIADPGPRRQALSGDGALVLGIGPAQRRPLPAFLISFFAIAVAWRDHHDIFKYVRRVDSRLRTLNTFWLLMTVLNPFATNRTGWRPHPAHDGDRYRPASGDTGPG